MTRPNRHHATTLAHFNHLDTSNWIRSELRMRVLRQVISKTRGEVLLVFDDSAVFVGLLDVSVLQRSLLLGQLPQGSVGVGRYTPRSGRLLGG